MCVCARVISTLPRVLSGKVQVPFAHNGCPLPEGENFDFSDAFNATDNSTDVDVDYIPESTRRRMLQMIANDTFNDTFVGQDLGIDKVSVSLALHLKSIGDGRGRTSIYLFIYFDRLLLDVPDVYGGLMEVHQRVVAGTYQV